MAEKRELQMKEITEQLEQGVKELLHQKCIQNISEPCPNSIIIVLTIHF